MIDVIYIAGAPRSGTTVLARLIGELPGVFNAGEVRFVWRQVLRGGKCGCGAELTRCEDWKEVLRSISPPSNTQRRLARAARAHSRIAALPRALIWRRVSHRLPRPMTDLLAATVPVYSSAAAAANAAVVVDASKSPSYAYSLTTQDGIRLHVVHLVRDPRAVAYSWLRSQRSDRPAPIRMAGAAYAGLKWTVWNVCIAAALRPLARSYTLVRYEDLMRAPELHLRRIADSTGTDARRLPITRSPGPVVTLGVNHSIYGNGYRFAGGRVELAADTEWSRQMSRPERALVNALTWPINSRYGYGG